MCARSVTANPCGCAIMTHPEDLRSVTNDAEFVPAGLPAEDQNGGSCSANNHFVLYEVENQAAETCLLFKLLTGCVVAAGQCA